MAGRGTMIRLAGLLLLLTALLGCSLDLNNPKPADVPELVERIQDGRISIDDRAAAIEAIGILKEEGGDAVPALIECLNEPRLRRFAAEALTEVGAPAVPALVERLNDSSLETPRRIEVIGILA